MKIILSSAAILVLACTMAPAALPQAAQQAEAPKAAADPNPDDPNKVTCKNMEVKQKLPSAVIRKKRICHTKAEWEEVLKVNEEMMKRYRDEFRKGSPPN